MSASTSNPRTTPGWHASTASPSACSRTTAVGRIVVEPDVGNEKSVALVRRLGMNLGAVVQPASKQAQLALLTRERYAASR